MLFRLKHSHNIAFSACCALFVLSSILGCKKTQNQDTGDAIVISIDNYENRIISRTDIIATTDTVELGTGSYFMGDVSTVCVSDTMVYVLDRANAIWAFRYPSGDFVKRIQKVGHGNGEYISVRSMVLNDSLLYLLDPDTRTVLTYDIELNYKSSFHYGFPALDFIKIEDGFLFLNLIATNELHRIIRTDDHGKIQQSYLPSDMSLDMIYSEKSFIQNTKGEIFIFPPFSNEIYQWTSEGPILKYKTDFGKNNRKEDVKSSHEITVSQKAFNTHFFFVGNHIVNRFIYKDKGYFSFYDLDKKAQYQGMVDTTDIIPFVPQWQSKHGLIGIVPTIDYDKWKPKKDSCDAALFIFHLK